MLKLRTHAIVWAGALVMVLDGVTKLIALKYLPYGQAVPVLPLFNLSLRFNKGVAFSFLSSSEMPGLITVVALLSTVLFGLWYRRVNLDCVGERLGIVMIMGGALGNVLDRLYYGHVVDFIEVYYKQYFWPAFNIADAAICVGAGLVILSTLKRDGRHEHAKG